MKKKKLNNLKLNKKTISKLDQDTVKGGTDTWTDTGTAIPPPTITIQTVIIGCDRTILDCDIKNIME